MTDGNERSSKRYFFPLTLDSVLSQILRIWKEQFRSLQYLNLRTLFGPTTLLLLLISPLFTTPCYLFQNFRRAFLGDFRQHGHAANNSNAAIFRRRMPEMFVQAHLHNIVQCFDVCVVTMRIRLRRWNGSWSSRRKLFVGKDERCKNRKELSLLCRIQLLERIEKSRQQREMRVQRITRGKIRGIIYVIIIWRRHCRRCGMNNVQQRIQCCVNFYVWSEKKREEDERNEIEPEKRAFLGFKRWIKYQKFQMLFLISPFTFHGFPSFSINILFFSLCFRVFSFPFFSFFFLFSISFHCFFRFFFCPSCVYTYCSFISASSFFLLISFFFFFSLFFLFSSSFHCFLFFFLPRSNMCQQRTENVVLEREILLHKNARIVHHSSLQLRWTEGGEEKKRKKKREKLNQFPSWKESWRLHIVSAFFIEIFLNLSINYKETINYSTSTIQKRNKKCNQRWFSSWDICSEFFFQSPQSITTTRINSPSQD